MDKVKIFDVVKLKNDEKATILNVSDKMCLVDIADQQKRHQLIYIDDIKEVIYRNNIK